MSWLEWNGEVWGANDQDASFDIYLHAQDSAARECTWTWHLQPFEEDREPPYRSITVELSDLGFQERDWRHLSGREIRSSPAWIEAQEYVGEYGKLFVPNVSVCGWFPKFAGDPAKEDAHWKGHDFVLRIGERDGLAFPCELEAWLIRDQDYHRKIPETLEELQRAPEGPPNLRILALGKIRRATVPMARCGDDPVSAARRRIEAATGLAAWDDAKLEWWPDRTSRFGDSRERSSGRSTVTFAMK